MPAPLASPADVDNSGKKKFVSIYRQQNGYPEAKAAAAKEPIPVEPGEPPPPRRLDAAARAPVRAAARLYYGWRAEWEAEAARAREQAQEQEREREGAQDDKAAKTAGHAADRPDYSDYPTQLGPEGPFSASVAGSLASHLLPGSTVDAAPFGALGAPAPGSSSIFRDAGVPEDYRPASGLVPVHERTGEPLTASEIVEIRRALSIPSRRSLVAAVDREGEDAEIPDSRKRALLRGMSGASALPDVCATRPATRRPTRRSSTAAPTLSRPSKRSTHTSTATRTTTRSSTRAFWTR